MPDWLMYWLGQVQGGLVRDLAHDIRTGSLATLWIAVSLGALHALTPGHGKAAMTAYFLGREADIGKGLRVALFAALLHVASGFGLFVVLNLIAGQAPSVLGRGSPAITALGYGLIVIAGLVMIGQSVRPHTVHGDGAHTLTAGMGLLPCPLTISVLGFAWTQASLAMIGLVVVSLTLGIALTIGAVALGAIAGRRLLGAAAHVYMPGLVRWSRVIQGAAGVLIVAIGLSTLANQL